MKILSAIVDRARALKYVLTERTSSRYSQINSPTLRLIAETVRQVKRDDVTLMAAGVAYYAILSLFPLTLLLLSVLSFFTDAETSRSSLERFFSVYLPDSVGFVDQIASPSRGASGLIGLAGLVGLMWTGTAMIAALTRSINRAFGIHDDRPFYKDRPLSILFGIGIIAAFAASLFGTAAIEAVAQFDVPVIGRQEWLRFAAYILPLLVTFTSFMLVYKVLPRANVRWKRAFPAALFGTVLFELAKVLFVLYINRLASFEVYGGMALLVVLMVWSYFSALVVLVGAEAVSAKRHLMGEDQYDSRALGRTTSAG